MIVVWSAHSSVSDVEPSMELSTLVLNAEVVDLSLATSVLIYSRLSVRCRIYRTGGRYVLLWRFKALRASTTVPHDMSVTWYGYTAVFCPLVKIGYERIVVDRLV